MLTAFNYYEPEEENRIQKGMKENAFFEKEVEIAHAHVRTRQNVRQESMKTCPICSNENISLFYSKWGVAYFRCKNCYSVMADVTEEEADLYQNNNQLILLRKSDAYQKDGSKNRYVRWEELIDWIRFRSFRYLHKNTELRILDYGTKWKGLIDLFRGSDLCKTYTLKDSVYSDGYAEDEGLYDIVLAVDYLQHEANPRHFLQEVYGKLENDGLFILNTKVGSGIDILALGEKNKNVFPYEHIMLPSKEGIRQLLHHNGFELLEFTTPGTFDVNFLKNNLNDIEETDYFLRYFLETSTPRGNADFQHFIQKNGLSSYAQVIARKSKKEINE